MRGSLLADEADGIAGVSIPDLDIALPVTCLAHGPVVAQELAGPGVLASAHKGGENEGALTDLPFAASVGRLRHRPFCCSAPCATLLPS